MTTLGDFAAARARLRSPPRAARGWLGDGLAACMIGWGTNQFTPMLLLYRARLGLSAPVVEAMFALYAIGLVPGLLAGGSLSDRICPAQSSCSRSSPLLSAAGCSSPGRTEPDGCSPAG